MGNQKLKWTSEEEEALIAGIAKHGTGKWKNILRDPDFAPSLTHRSNIDLKDKWRNMSINPCAQGSKDKVKITTTKPIEPSPVPDIQNPASTVVLVPGNDMPDEPSKSLQEAKNAPRHNSMIFEALSALNNPNGVDIGTIVKYIEQRHEVPQNFRRLLSSKLRRLALQGKLEKMQNCSYKIRKETSPVKKTTPPLRQKDVVRPTRPVQSSHGFVTAEETLEEAAVTTAYMLSEAENKSFVAAEAVKEAERVANLAENMNALLQLAKEIYEQCSQGEMVLLNHPVSDRM
ncbi:telomere repeat-binding factor 4 [Impatiens glandulifera]|uniref:telomere repeat-binding factor 4 n=1 Tax=Impatiens glandulifera TaxID=253017 RepID=UPI001FB0B2FA|nr:telomere repeat-binding factor 4 [Impatiens glandulifera]